MIKLEELAKLSTKPDIYTKGTASMWNDEHISTYLLEAHINPDIDVASRKQSTINKTVDWILRQCDKEGMSILDLGCGPGLYTEVLTSKGHSVTGVDFSKRSIEYAKNHAAEKAQDITYLYQNYLELDMENRFDLAIMIYCDFVVLSPQERAILLANVRRALKPSGVFIFDVLNDKTLAGKTFARSWEASEGGFWRAKPYLLLSETFHYPENKVMLDQHIVAEESGNCNIYRFWHHYFAPDDLKTELDQNGFTDVEYYENVLPDGRLYRANDVTFFKATRSKDK